MKEYDVPVQVNNLDLHTISNHIPIHGMGKENQKIITHNTYTFPNATVQKDKEHSCLWR